MENKKKNKIEISKFEFEKTFIYSALIVAYFVFGLYIGENSAGAGGYDSDFKLIWDNLNLLKNGIITNLDNPLYNDSRPPLSYILHIFFNPFINDKDSFRTSTFIISSIVPFLLFFSIKKKYSDLNFNLIFILCLILTLSPYFRTTAYWGLGENYAFIFVILTSLLLENFKKDILIQSDLNLTLRIILLCFLSSIIVYFDQKLIFIPLFVFLSIIFSKINLKFKLLSIVAFVLFALPYIYLIYIWGAIIPSSAAKAREVGLTINFFHPIYCITIIAFYIFPFLFMKNLKIVKSIKNNAKIIISLLILSLSYFFIIFYFYDFETLPLDGKGVFFKLYFLIFENIDVQIYLTLITFLTSVVIIFLFFEHLTDFLIIFYFVILSLFTFPFYQEYLDPILLILLFTFLKIRLSFNKINIIFLITYFIIFSLGSNIYYKLTL